MYCLSMASQSTYFTSLFGHKVMFASSCAHTKAVEMTTILQCTCTCVQAVTAVTHTVCASCPVFSAGDETRYVPLSHVTPCPMWTASKGIRAGRGGYFKRTASERNQFERGQHYSLTLPPLPSTKP